MRQERRLVVEGMNAPARPLAPTPGTPQRCPPLEPWRLPHARGCRCGVCSVMLVNVLLLVELFVLLARTCRGTQPAPTPPGGR